MALGCQVQLHIVFDGFGGGKDFTLTQLLRRGAAGQLQHGHQLGPLGGAQTFDGCKRLVISHQQTGKTFTDYVQGVQMQWAAAELRKGRKSGEIAEQLGYLNQDGFAKSFVRVFGCSPRKWLATQESAEKSKE